MEQFLFYYHTIIDSIYPYWGEMVGGFLLALMINLFRAKGAQKDAFGLISMGFCTIIMRDAFNAFLTASKIIFQRSIISETTSETVSLILTSIATSFFVVSAFKNLRFYFSVQGLLGTLSLLLIGIAVGLPAYEPLHFVAIYLPPVYLTVALLILGLSFYGTKATRQDLTIRAVGNGFFVLTLCYAYQMFNLVENSQQVLLLGYMIAMVLALAAQIQFLNRSNEQLEGRLDAERKSKTDSWEISPFPIIISRLRDDMIIYMNPMAREMLGIRAEEVQDYRLSQYFTDANKKGELLDLVRTAQIVKNFEVEVHHPEKGGGFWIDMTTRTTDFDEEIVLFTTFKDITDQKKTALLLKEQASTDPLTELNNRRQFEIMAKQALHVAERYRQPYSMLMFDIDFFKNVNDTYGHEAGDAVLVNLAKTLKDTLRKSDIVARYGGEEFVAFLAQTPPEEGKIAAEHVREEVSLMHTYVNGKDIQVTVSVGVSDGYARSLESLIKQADEALYYSKEHGRNQVSLYREIKGKK